MFKGIFDTDGVKMFLKNITEHDSTFYDREKFRELEIIKAIGTWDCSKGNMAKFVIEHQNNRIELMFAKNDNNEVFVTSMNAEFDTMKYIEQRESSWLVYNFCQVFLLYWSNSLCKKIDFL